MGNIQDNVQVIRKFIPPLEFEKYYQEGSRELKYLCAHGGTIPKIDQVSLLVHKHCQMISNNSQEQISFVIEHRLISRYLMKIRMSFRK